ncbi:hypothetical protein HKX48_007626 [Thoreauomyces humboldtii]|nr:hypothetical protein HKX48_007626 [Thoreauomyces humboldtii]
MADPTPPSKASAAASAASSRVGSAARRKSLKSKAKADTPSGLSSEAKSNAALAKSTSQANTLPESDPSAIIPGEAAVPPPEVTSILTEPESDVLPPAAEDSVGTSAVLLGRFRKLLTLVGYSDDMWTDEHTNTVSSFLHEQGTRKLLVFMDPQTSPPVLKMQSVLPTQELPELMYFIRTSKGADEPITDANFETKVQYGTVSGPAMDSLLRVMQGVYAPMFVDNKRWPESARKEFSNQLHKFMALLTDTAFQMKGHTVLYVPREDLGNPDACAKAKDVVQRLESLVVHWTRQIKDVVNNQHASETTENSGPIEEIQFWRSRCEDLSGISVQLNRADVQQILTILDMAKSSYLEQFVRLANLIQEGTTQAQENLKFLSTLTDPCEILANTEPKDIPAILPRLLICIRIIWANSNYYNTKERLTSLLRKVSNEIIRRCCAKISLEGIFHGDVQMSMTSLQESINCGESWKTIYRRTCHHIAKFANGRWDFDESSIFAQIDAFVQRCRDLLEVCEGQIQFARKLNGGEKATIPFFGGSKGLEIGKRYLSIFI